MGSKTFSIREAVTYGFRTVKSKFLFFVMVMILPIIVSMVFRFVGAGTEYMLEQIADNEQMVIASVLLTLFILIISLASGVINTIFTIGTIGIYIKTVTGEETTIKDIWSTHGVFWRYIWLNFISGILLLLGLVFFILPGLFLIILYQFSLYILLEKKMGALKILSESAELTKGVRIKLVLFGIVLALINIGGALLFVVGLLITVPATALAHVYVYRKLNESQGLQVESRVKGQRVK